VEKRIRKPFRTGGKLTVVNDVFDPGSAVRAGISGGWPSIIANLETLLETGETLPEI
jgi:hypothetical protein